MYVVVVVVVVARVIHGFKQSKSCGRTILNFNLNSAGAPLRTEGTVHCSQVHTTGI